MSAQTTDQRLAAFTMGAKIGVKLALNRVIDVSARPKDIAAVVDAINDLILAHFKARDTDDVPAITNPPTPAGKLLGVEIAPPCSCGAAGGFDPLCWHHGINGTKQSSEEVPT